MPNEPLAKLTSFGQSIWLDYIRRDLFDGELQNLIDDYSVRGETSNPAIFDKAIAGSDLYDSDVSGADSDDPEDIFFDLAIADIKSACGFFRPVFDSSGGKDGFVSLEVSPRLAYKTDETIEQAEELWNRVDAPNVMIKIPGTEAGLPAIEATIAKGINVNVTLLFSTDRHMDAADAYIAGLKKAQAAGIDLSTINSVASFFVSRVDTLVDQQLGGIGSDAAKALEGKAAVANAKIAYELAKDKFSGADWEALVSAGANVQRPLWASTSTKNPEYSDVKYVAELIGPDTVNTAPLDTIKDFADHGEASQTLTEDVAAAHDVMAQLASVGIDLHADTDKLEKDGVAAFIESYEDLLKSIDAKRTQLDG